MPFLRTSRIHGLPGSLTLLSRRARRIGGLGGGSARATGIHLSAVPLLDVYCLSKNQPGRKRKPCHQPCKFFHECILPPRAVHFHDLALPPGPDLVRKLTINPHRFPRPDSAATSKVTAIMNFWKTSPASMRSGRNPPAAGSPDGS